MSHPTLGGCHSHFTDEETKVQRGKVTAHRGSQRNSWEGWGLTISPPLGDTCHLLLTMMGALGGPLTLYPWGRAGPVRCPGNPNHGITVSSGYCKKQMHHQPPPVPLSLSACSPTLRILLASWREIWRERGSLPIPFGLSNLD